MNKTFINNYLNMKNSLLLFVYLFLWGGIVRSQNREYEFGKIGSSDMNYSECPFDKQADAVVLFDKGESNFVEQDGNFNVVFKRTVRIKILNEAGINWANVEIPYYQSNNIFEDVTDIVAVSYNFEAGTLNKTEMKASNCHAEKKNENWMLTKFAIPNVKVGSVIEYKYSIESQYVFNLRDWEFQWKIPVLYSEYKVSMIPFYQYSFLMQGATKFDEQTSVVSNYDRQYGSIKFQDYVHTYIMKNVAAFKDEEFITSPNDYIIKLDFQLSKIIFPQGYQKDIITTWPLLIKDMLDSESFGKHISKCEKMTPKVFNLATFSNLTQQQKFDSVINFVKKTYIWNKNERLYTSKNIKKFQEDKFGNSADINLFAIGLLRGVGINAQPVIISTRENGKIKLDYPFLDFFDYVLIKADVDSTVILSDATDIFIANNRLPVNCINDRGLVIQKDKVEWVNLQAKTMSRIRTSVINNLSANQCLSKVSLNASEYDGLNFRKKFGTDKKAIIKHLSENEYNINDSTVVIKNMESFSSPYIVSFVNDSKPEIINNKIYISPFLQEVIQNNPLKQQSRSYPIDMNYAKQRVYVSTTTIPEGYKIDFLPVNKTIKNAYFEMDYNVNIFEKIVYVSFAYSFKKPVYDAGDYLMIKSFYNDIIGKANEKIVFVKE